MARRYAIPLEDEIFYPESDGEPMAETQLHLQEMIYLIDTLEERFLDEPGVFVGGNLSFYYEQGVKDAVVAPDAFVAKGLADGKALRRKYLLWEERQLPCFAAEVTSETTRKRDERDGTKWKLYERLGIEEYFLFDPEGDYLNPRLQGYRLAGGRYRPIAPEPDGSLLSATTGILFRAEGVRLRLTAAATGAVYLRREEETRARRQAEERATASERRAAAEARARRQAEEQVRALQEELARLRGR
jgi:Uma2 family endonuclease